MDEVVRRLRLQCGRRNGEDAAAVAVVVWRKRRSGAVLGVCAYQKSHNGHENKIINQIKKNERTKREPTLMLIKMLSQTPSDVKNRERRRNGGVENGGVGWSG